MRLLFVFLLVSSMLKNCACDSKQASANSSEPLSIADSIQLLYNYGPESSYQYTFLEFGSTMCAACKDMEAVMDSVRTEYPHTVQVRFMNISHSYVQEWAQYFNIEFIPVQVVLDRQGKVVFQHEGYISMSDLQTIWN